jgi:membrane protein DedA with SNARE-associated domain
MERELKLPKLTVIAVVTFVAVAVISLTVGKDLYEGRSQSLFSFGLIHFSGYLFFIMMPVEMAFVYYLSWFNEVTLILVALSTAVLAQLIDYIIGVFFNSQFITKVISEKKILKAEGYIQKYGALTVFLFNLLPLSSPVISLAAGVLRYKLKNLLICSIGGLLLKYLLLSLIF